MASAVIRMVRVERGMRHLCTGLSSKVGILQAKQDVTVLAI